MPRAPSLNPHSNWKNADPTGRIFQIKTKASSRIGSPFSASGIILWERYKSDIKRRSKLMYVGTPIHVADVAL